MTVTTTSDRVAQLTAQGVIDCDLHCTIPSIKTLHPYLSDYWREQTELTAYKGPGETSYPPGMPTSARPGSKPEQGPVGSDLGLLQSQALDPWNTKIGILTPSYAIESVHNPDGAAAVASAANDWVAEHWLAQDSRLRASLIVPIQEPDMAAREIDRLGGHPGFVQVYLPVRSEAPYGTRRYAPVFDAAARNNLAVAIGFGGQPPTPPTPSGWPSFYLEEWADMASIFQSQLMSLIVEGVFDRTPSLRVALVESGFTWLPSLLWRWDKEWKGLRRQVPWVRRAPTEYVHEHVRLTVQPWDAPADGRHLLQIIDQLGSDDLLMFSTDYPHWHYDTMEEALPPAGLSDALVQKIMRGNAEAFYGF
jgi:predicted TIM-barrel fold metal-dependent hydrolase